MNRQGFIKGTMKIQIQGKLIEAYLQACTNQGCRVWDIKRLNADNAVMSIRLEDWPVFRRLRKKYKCKIKVLNGNGIPFFFRNIVKRTSLMVAFLAAVIFVFLLANTLWSIRISGLTPELEAGVEEKLSSYGVTPGKLTIGMEDPNEIQRKLLDDLPDLLWIGVKKQGTSYHLYGVEKTRQDVKENPRPANLIAEKKGMIIRSFIKKGRPTVSVYDVVKKGDLLATGQLVEEGDEYVQAEGEVIAETWYKVEQNLPLKHGLEVTRGKGMKEYHIQTGKVTFPIWGWWKKDDGTVREEQVMTDWHLFGWKVPIQLEVHTSYPIDLKSFHSSKKELLKSGLEYAIQNLEQHLGPDAVIKEEKVLHLRVESGKVKLILLMKVHEDIAVTKFISQGD